MGPHTPTEDDSEEVEFGDRQPHTPEDSPPPYTGGSPSPPDALVIQEAVPRRSHHRHRSKRHHRSRSSLQPFTTDRSNSASLRSPTPHTPPGSSQGSFSHSAGHSKRRSSSPPPRKRKKESKTKKQQQIEVFRHKVRVCQS